MNNWNSFNLRTCDNNDILQFIIKIFLNFQGKPTRKVSEGETLLGKHRKKWKLKQCTTQRILAFNERYEIYRCRINKKTVSDLHH